MTNSELAAAKALCDAATPEPWAFGYARVISVPVLREYDRLEALIPTDAPDEAYEHLPDPDVCYVTPSYGDTATGQRASDGEFIAASRTLVPRLLALVETLRSERDGRITMIDHQRAITYWRDQLAGTQHQSAYHAAALCEWERDCKQARAERDTAIAERDALARELADMRAECEAMRPVVKAAEAWRDLEFASCASIDEVHPDAIDSHERTLLVAVDAYRVPR